jgi:transcriptional regulator with XRE-family HTH domain
MPRSVFSEPYEAFTQALIAERKKAGLTQEDLAARLHKRQSFVSKMERGERRIDVVEFLVIARAIGIDPLTMLSHVNDSLPANARI